MRPLQRFYPLLFVVVPSLHSAASNPGVTRLSDLLRVTGGLLLAFGLIYLSVSWALGMAHLRPLAPVALMTIIVWFYSVALTRVFAPTTIGHLPMLLAGLLGALMGLAWLKEHPDTLHQLDRVLALTGVLLVGWSVLQISMNLIHERRALMSSPLVQELIRPIAVGSGVESSGRPNIYLILLDEHANSTILQEQLGFDNRVFEDSLRRLGFTIPKQVRSNYAHTTLSLPSLLNFSFLSALASEAGPKATDPSLADYVLERNRTVGFLKAHGYQFIFFPSEWWPSTAHDSYADREFQVWDDFDPRHALARTELGRHLWANSQLSDMGPPDMLDPEYLRRTFEGLGRLDTRGTPTFVFAHLLLPHTPYVFDAHCGPRRAPDERNRRLYLDQLRCADSLVLHLVTTLIDRPGPPPVILLQGDHGTAMLDFDSAPTAGSVTPAQARERFGAFGAYLLPGGGGRLFADTLTLVNVFPKVLDFYFGANLPMAPDDLYMSLERAPFDFVRVDPRALK